MELVRGLLLTQRHGGQQWACGQGAVCALLGPGLWNMLVPGVQCVRLWRVASVLLRGLVLLAGRVLAGACL